MTTSPKSAVGNHSGWLLEKQLTFKPEGFELYILGSTIWIKRIQSNEKYTSSVDGKTQQLTSFVS